jgi:SAM-dependent methyltransferase
VWRAEVSDAQFGDFNPFADRGWLTLARRFDAVVPAGRQLRVLDVGCGTGQSRRVYASHLSWYLGVDLSREAVAVARRRDPATSFLQADALRLPVRDASVEAVAFSSVLHHVDDRPRALGEAKRALAPGGLVFAFDPNLHHPAMLLFRHPSSPLYRAEGVSPNERPLAPATLVRRIRRGQVRRIGQRCVSDIHTPGGGRPAQRTAADLQPRGLAVGESGAGTMVRELRRDGGGRKISGSAGSWQVRAC